MKTLNQENVNITREVTLNELVEGAIDAVISEAVTHFNKQKSKVRNPEEDARYFYNDEELTVFLQRIEYPDSVWVSTIKGSHDEFYAYRVGRVINTKKYGIKKY